MLMDKPLPGFWCECWTEDLTDTTGQPTLRASFDAYTIEHHSAVVLSVMAGRYINVLEQKAEGKLYVTHGVYDPSGVVGSAPSSLHLTQEPSPYGLVAGLASPLVTTCDHLVRSIAMTSAWRTRASSNGATLVLNA